MLRAAQSTQFLLGSWEGNLHGTAIAYEFIDEKAST
jgi:hypothetical protein